jgi:hypothetical protein
VHCGELGQAVQQANVLQYHSIYGGCGISVFAVRSAMLDDMAQRVPLVRFESPDPREGGRCHRGRVAAEPVGRNPRQCTVGFDDLDDGVRRLAGCPQQVVPSPATTRRSC